MKLSDLLNVVLEFPFASVTIVPVGALFNDTLYELIFVDDTVKLSDSKYFESLDNFISLFDVDNEILVLTYPFALACFAPATSSFTYLRILLGSFAVSLNDFVKFDEPVVSSKYHQTAA